MNKKKTIHELYEAAVMADVRRVNKIKNSKVMSESEKIEDLRKRASRISRLYDKSERDSLDVLESALRVYSRLKIHHVI